MKKLLIASILLFSCKSAFCIGGQVPSLVYQVGISSITMGLVSVSTSSNIGATQMDNPAMPTRVSVEIQNLDGSANLWCTAVSTTPTVNSGRKISAGASWIMSFTDKLFVPGFSSSQGTAINFYCLSDGAAATKAWVTQLK